MWSLLTAHVSALTMAHAATAAIWADGMWARLRARKEQRMHLDLPSGASVELRDRLKAKDKFAAQAAIRVNMNADGSTGAVSGSIMTMIETALLTRLLESWTLDVPLPGAHSCGECTGDSLKWHEHIADYIGDTLDLDDYDALSYWLAPYVNRVMDTPNPGTSSASVASS